MVSKMLSRSIKFTLLSPIILNSFYQYFVKKETKRFDYIIFQ